MPTCYMCDNSSTSMEHTPAKCFFPTGHRHNLITVPACVTHNENTSLDDEYVRNIITSSIENNQTAVNHFFDKCLRSYQRHFDLVIPIVNSLKDISEFKTGAKAYAMDRARFDKVIRKIAYGLFFHQFGIRWDTRLLVMTDQLKNADMSLDELGELADSLNQEVEKVNLQATNPLIFQYGFTQYQQGQYDYALFMLFYEGFPLWVMPDQNSTDAGLS